MPKMPFLVMLLVGCATTTQTIKAPDQEEVYRAARHQEAAVNGCSTPCPSATERCVDDYGACFSPCAFDRLNESERAQLEKMAHDADPTSSYFVTCPAVPGATEI